MDPHTDTLVPGMTIRFRRAGRLEAAVVAEVDSGAVTVVTAAGERRRLGRDAVRPAADARMRRLAELAGRDPAAAAAACADYLERWMAGRAGPPARRRTAEVLPSPALCAAVLDVVTRAAVPVSRPEVVAALPEHDPVDCDRALAELVAQGRLRRSGRTRGTRFAVPAHALF